MARKSRKAAVLLTENSQMDSTPSEYKIYQTALYARISAEEHKRSEGTTIDNQLSLLRDYASDKPYLMVTREYADNGVSGVTFDRQGFNQMILDMRAGKIDCIIVKDLSRLGRNYLEAGEYLEKIFPFFGVRFIAVTDGYDNIAPDAANEGLIVPLKNLINDIYAKDLSKKVSSAFKIKQKQGKFVGCIAPYGYLKSPDDHNKLIVDEEVRDIVERIFELRAKGTGYSGIIRQLNAEGIPSPSRYKYIKGLTSSDRSKNGLWKIDALKSILCNPVYVGDMEQGINRAELYKGIKSRYVPVDERIYVKDTHEALISRELFEAVKKGREENSERFHKNYGKYDSLSTEENLLKGLVECGDCKKNMILWRDRSGANLNPPRVYYKYICNTCQILQEKSHSRKRIGKKDMEMAVEHSIRLHMKLFLDAQSVLEKLNQTEEAKQKNEGYKKEITEIKRRLERAGSMKNSLYRDYADGILSERDYLYAKEKYCREAENLDQKLMERLELQKQYEAGYEKNGRLATLVEEYKNFGELTEEIIRAFIRRIHVFTSDRIEIEYLFENELKDIEDMVHERGGVV